MSTGNVKFRDDAGAPVPTIRWQTEANATAIYAGEPVKLKSAGSPYVIPLADAEPVIGTTTAVIGIAASNSTHTASADGVVDVYIPKEGVLYEVKAKTAGNVDTQTKINALCGDRVLFDLTSSTYTVDESAGDGANNGVVIVGGNPAARTLYVALRGDATILN